MKITGWLIDADYITENGKAVVRLWCKDNYGRDVVILDRNFEPYFYLIPSDPILGISELREVEVVKGDRVFRPVKVEITEKRDFGVPLKAFKIYVEHPQLVPAFREEMEQFGEVREADVLYAVRYIIDRGLYPMDGIEVEGEKRELKYGDIAIEALSVKHLPRADIPELKIAAFDCEMCSSTKGMPNPKADPIVIISIATKEGVQLYSLEEFSEREMIKKFVKFIQEYNPDLIVGYNIDEFDWYYLKERASLYKVPLEVGKDRSLPSFKPGGIRRRVSISGRPNIDLYFLAAQQLNIVKVKTLENIAEYLGVMKKSERVRIPGAEISEYWRDSSKRKLLLCYARDDALSAYKIAKNLLPMQYELAKLSRLPLDEVSKIGRGRQVEAFLAAEAYKVNELVPSKGSGGETYVGGFVLEPKKGVHENVVCLDFTAMYPSIMIAFNISPDTLMKKGNGYVAPEVGHIFRKDIEGFFTHILKSLVEKRSELKKAMSKMDRDSPAYRLLNIRQQTLKVLTNAFYGYTGWAAARWYRRECAEATAAWGRYFIKESIKEAEVMGLEVIYGDTDSLFIKYPGAKSKEEVLEKARDFAAHISAKFPLELEIENFYDVVFFTEAKKRYAGLTSEGEVVVKGLEVKRGDWCELAKRIQSEVIKIILRDRDPAKAADLVKETIRKIREAKIPFEDLVIYKTLTKDIESYESRLAHVLAAKKAKEEEMKAEVGAKIGYIIIKGSGILSERAYPVEMFKHFENNKLIGVNGEEYQLDIDYYINNQILPSASRVLNYFDFSQAELKGERALGKQINLEHFF
ncbi:MAG: DNA-directed DNA polymerase [Methanocellales archaeon]